MPILNWLTRDQDIGAAKGVSYRLLEEASELSAGDPNTGNMLIQGDNLEALKALLPFYARPSEVHLYRFALQHALRVRALRRQPRTHAEARDDVAAAGTASRLVGGGRLYLGVDRR